MKLKVVIASLAVVATAVVAFAFTPKKAHKPTSTQTYYYATGVCNQRIDPNISNSDCRLESLDEENFETTSNWTTTSNTSFSNADYIGAITFDEGTGAGQLTLQQALNGVFNHYKMQSPKALPADNSSITVSGVTVTIRRKASAL